MICDTILPTAEENQLLHNFATKFTPLLSDFRVEFGWAITTNALNVLIDLKQSLEMIRTLSRTNISSSTESTLN